MLIYSPLSAYFDDVIPQQPALSNDGKQRQPALGDFTSPIAGAVVRSTAFLTFSDSESEGNSNPSLAGSMQRPRGRGDARV
jgi:hypothetical protein